MTQVARVNPKPLKERDSHVRFLVIVVPIFDIAPPVRRFLAVAIANLTPIESRISALYSKGAGLARPEKKESETRKACMQGAV